MNDTSWIDGVFVRPAVVPVTDRGFLHGLALFETLGAVAGELPLWERHLARLHRSAASLGLPCDVPEGLRDAAGELLARCELRDGILRITLSAGDEAPRWLMTCRARVERDPPLRLSIARARRSEDDPTAALKTTSRAFYELARTSADDPDADDVVICGRGDEVLETMYGNLFCAVEGEVRTPPLDGRVLPGVGREVLLDALGGTIREAEIRLEDLRHAHGVWVTNAVYGPRRAVLDGGRPTLAGGTVENRLTAAWRAAVQS